MAENESTAVAEPAQDDTQSKPKVELTAPQATIISRLHETGGKHTAKAKPNLIRTLDALVKKGMVEYTINADDDTVEVNLAVKKKGNRPVWNPSLARDENDEPVPRNEKGQLTGVPHNFPQGHYGLTVKQFKDRATWLRWKAVEADKQAANLERRAADARAKAQEFRDKAEETEKGVSPEVMLERIKKRRERMLAKLDAEEAEIQAQVNGTDDAE